MKGIHSTRQDPEGWCVNTADKTCNEALGEPGLYSHNRERLHMKEKTNNGRMCDYSTTGIRRPVGH